MKPPARFHSLEDLAARWGVSVKTLRRIVRRGELKTHRIGAQLRVSDEDVRSFEAPTVAEAMAARVPICPVRSMD